MVPWTTDAELLYLCSFQCTLCGVPLFQLHHIDGNHENNNPDNWTILCQLHHDLANRDLQVAETHTRKFTGELLKNQRKRHIESHLFSRFGIDIVANGKINEELRVTEEQAENSTLIKRTKIWLMQG
jgi:hypothetical protein